MKHLLFTTFLLFFSLANYAQTNAVTETGERVVLYDNGTWKSLETTPAWDTRLDTLIYKKPIAADFLVKSSHTRMGVWINPKKWSFEKNTDAESPQEYKFRFKEGEVYSMIITEDIQLSLSSLKAAALKNAQKAAPDAHITSEETRNVNGLIVCMRQMEGTIEGINFKYFCYYYSSENGTIQFMCYTFATSFEKYKKSMEDLLNGLVTATK